MPYSRDSDAIRKLSGDLEHLRIQARHPYMKVSETVKDLISFCLSNMAHDQLINPEKENPFKPKKTCEIL
ncbi:hypothetical protein ACOMHN_004077 [Nucella lapillus]